VSWITERVHGQAVAGYSAINRRAHNCFFVENIPENVENFATVENIPENVENFQLFF
jgi:hypothetical protein